MKVALTGMIAAGKSTVLKLFSGLGWMTVETDALAREVWYSKEGQGELRRLLGCEKVERDVFYRRFLEDKVFRKTWESFVHPRVRAAWVAVLEQNPSANIVVELPLLYENGLEDRFDKVIVLTASKEDAQNRWERKGRSKEFYRMLSGLLVPIEEKLNRADFVIKNDSTLMELAQTVEALHTKLLKHHG